MDVTDLVSQEEERFSTLPIGQVPSSRCLWTHTWLRSVPPLVEEHREER